MELASVGHFLGLRDNNDVPSWEAIVAKGKYNVGGMLVEGVGGSFEFGGISDFYTSSYSDGFENKEKDGDNIRTEEVGETNMKSTTAWELMKPFVESDWKQLVAMRNRNLFRSGDCSEFNVEPF